MSYTSPPTFTTGAVLTAPQLTILGNDIVDLDRRTSPVGAVRAGSVTSTNTTYTDLAGGPSVPIQIGANGLAQVLLHSAIANASFPLASYYGFRVSGATTVAASDATAIGFTSTFANAGIRTGTSILIGGLNPGMNTFTAQGRMDPGTGPAQWVDSRIAVVALGA